MSQPQPLDVAIIGGGVSGTYSAWRLQQAHGDSQRIQLFEYGDRIGGTLLQGRDDVLGRLAHGVAVLARGVAAAQPHQRQGRDALTAPALASSDPRGRPAVAQGAAS